MKVYRYELVGTDGGGQAFTVSGELEVSSALGFAGAPGAAMSDAYQKLTGGKTEYGKPGQGSCRGPYSFRKLTLELAE